MNGSGVGTFHWSDEAPAEECTAGRIEMRLPCAERTGDMAEMIRHGILHTNLAMDSDEMTSGCSVCVLRLGMSFPCHVMIISILFAKLDFPHLHGGPIGFPLAGSAVLDSAETFRISPLDANTRKVESGVRGVLRWPKKRCGQAVLACRPPIPG